MIDPDHELLKVTSLNDLAKTSNSRRLLQNEARGSRPRIASVQRLTADNKRRAGRCRSTQLAPAGNESLLISNMGST